ncbi:unnamed protein product [Protopolystoma xenopodis]|uniref:Uncharacterized protein n=1 Tax=Protopolystoma xenopodis TaxID=117903 RepID=A0A3S5BA59_9PLAT|nr:unnamed protein product [Protopolystoma xenopodis]
METGKEALSIITSNEAALPATVSANGSLICEDADMQESPHSFPSISDATSAVAFAPLLGSAGGGNSCSPDCVIPSSVTGAQLQRQNQGSPGLSVDEGADSPEISPRVGHAGWVDAGLLRRQACLSTATLKRLAGISFCGQPNTVVQGRPVELSQGLNALMQYCLSYYKQVRITLPSLMLNFFNL